MTPEQLDEIEKLTDGWNRTGLTQYAEAIADQALPLVKALREARDDLRQSEERRDYLSMLICTPERQLGDEIINLRRELAESSRRLATALRECAFANERLRRLKAETGWGKRECGCQCQREAGDSACHMHGEEAT